MVTNGALFHSVSVLVAFLMTSSIGTWANAQDFKAEGEILQDVILSQSQLQVDPAKHLKYAIQQRFFSRDSRFRTDAFLCTDLDPDKEFALSGEEEDSDLMKVCDACPKLPLEKTVDAQFIPYSVDSLIEVTHNSISSECVASCLEVPQCVATNFNPLENSCSHFNSTRGELRPSKGFTFVTQLQPTGIIEDWVYSRHTRIVPRAAAGDSEDGNVSGQRTLTNSTYPECLSACEFLECKFVSFSHKNQDCLLIDDLTPEDYTVDYEYGYIGGFKLNTVLEPEESQSWRFQLIEDSEEGADDGTNDYLLDELISTSNHTIGYGYIENSKCNRYKLAGCDQKTGKQKCRFPENLPEGTDTALPVCPTSQLTIFDAIETFQAEKLNCLSDCAATETCIGITWTMESQGSTKPQCNLVTIKKVLKEAEASAYVTEFYSLEVPKNINHRFSIYPNLQIDRTVPNNGVQEVDDVVDEEACLARCNSNPKKCQVASYNAATKRCLLSMHMVRAVSSRNCILIVRKPPINSVETAFKRMVGKEFVGEALDTYKLNISWKRLRAEMDMCMTSCLRYDENGQRCDGVSVKKSEITESSLSLQCDLFSKQSGGLSKNTGSEVYLKTENSRLFNQAEFDELFVFQEDDYYSCYRDESSTLPSLHVESVEEDKLYELSDEISGQSLRQKRGIRKKVKKSVKKAIKKVRQQIEKQAKRIGWEIVSQVVTAGIEYGVGAIVAAG